jgi:hypothetical protein
MASPLGKLTAKFFVLKESCLGGFRGMTAEADLHGPSKAVSELLREVLTPLSFGEIGGEV